MTLFVSYATPEYHLEACSLVQSLEVLGLDYHVAMLPSKGDWVANCGRKAAFLLRVWDGRPLCWVDADARVLSRPRFEPVDVAFHRFEGHAMSGTVYVGPGGKPFLEAWARRAEIEPDTWDQRHLDAAVMDSGCTFRELPPEYCFMFDNSRKHWPDAKPVIEHYQASRRLKR